MRGAFWRTALGHTLAVVAALLIAALAFLYRFNALGGALGGFDNDEFATLTRVDLVLAGQQPLRDFADGELRAWRKDGRRRPPFDLGVVIHFIV